MLSHNFLVHSQIKDHETKAHITLLPNKYYPPIREVQVSSCDPNPEGKMQ